jgi:hypothetical protein
MIREPPHEDFNPLNAKLNPICHLLALLGAHPILHVSRIRVKAILHLLNAITRLGYWPRPLKRANVIMILKPGKDPTDVTSYRPISLLPVIPKILRNYSYQD